MSRSLDLSNCIIYDGNTKQLQFHELFDMKKNFFSDSRIESIPLIKTENKCFVAQQHEKVSNIGVNSHLAPEISEDNTSSVNNSKINPNNVNIYKKCVFFVNNYNNCIKPVNFEKLSRNLAEENKSLQNNELENCISSFRNYQVNSTDVFTPNKYYSIQNINKNVNEDKIKTENELPSNNKPDDNEFKLFFLHNNSIKPIVSKNIKSGIYKKISKKICENSKTKNECKKKNVFISLSNKSGKIVSTLEFENLCKGGKIQNEDKTADFRKLDSELNNKIETTNLSPPYTKSSKDKLKYFAHEILKLPRDGEIEFNRKENQVIYKNRQAKKKTVYRIIRPEDLDIKSDVIQIADASEIQENYNELHTKGNPSTTKVSGRGRPRKQLLKKPIANDDKAVEIVLQTNATSKTRYGRLSKPPEYMHKIFKINKNDVKVSGSIYGASKDDDYKCSKAIPQDNKIITSDQTIKRERNIPLEYKCNVCNKIYLGKKKMIWHLEAFPDHRSNTTSENYLKSMSLYKFLVKKIQLVSDDEEEKIQTFLSDITDLVNQRQCRRSKLINSGQNLHFINSQASRVLGIREGHFGININDIDALPNNVIDPVVDVPILAIPAPPPRLDYNLSMSLDDTRLNLIEKMLPSDDSLVRTVDDLVNERIKNFPSDDVISSATAIHYDHVSDNAVEAVTMKETQPTPILDLSLELFQFNSN